MRFEALPAPSTKNSPRDPPADPQRRRDVHQPGTTLLDGGRHHILVGAQRRASHGHAERQAKKVKLAAASMRPARGARCIREFAARETCRWHAREAIVSPPSPCHAGLRAGLQCRIRSGGRSGGAGHGCHGGCRGGSRAAHTTRRRGRPPTDTAEARRPSPGGEPCIAPMRTYRPAHLGEQRSTARSRWGQRARGRRDGACRAERTRESVSPRTRCPVGGGEVNSHPSHCKPSHWASPQRTPPPHWHDPTRTHASAVHPTAPKPPTRRRCPRQQRQQGLLTEHEQQCAEPKSQPQCTPRGLRGAPTGQTPAVASYPPLAAPPSSRCIALKIEHRIWRRRSSRHKR